MPNPIQFSFKDRTTGAPVATAIVPEGYFVNASITDQYANDLVPLHAYTSAVAPDQSILLNSNSKGMWEHVINPLMKQTAKMTGVRKSNFAPYPDPDRYLYEYAAAIMDSWNRKMASDSRISQARSEAIRGVNTYQTTGGRSVEVGVTADHVYQNNYGDVYGVSGSAPDQELLNRLNWTEIHRR